MLRREERKGTDGSRRLDEDMERGDEAGEHLRACRRRVSSLGQAGGAARTGGGVRVEEGAVGGRGCVRQAEQGQRATARPGRRQEGRHRRTRETEPGVRSGLGLGSQNQPEDPRGYQDCFQRGAKEGLLRWAWAGGGRCHPTPTWHVRCPDSTPYSPLLSPPARGQVDQAAPATQCVICRGRYAALRPLVELWE